jgi:two-component system, chemotaxis family, chemotaxis protein CheY
MIMLNILIVDDTKSVHAFVKSLLSQSKNVKTTSVFDGAQAVHLLKENSDFDLILLDWEMPNLNGPDAFKQFLAMGITIPTIMMTTKNAEEDIVQMLNMGVSEYLMKPFTVDILFEKIEFASGQVLSYGA